jgi:hypothetical protein
MCFRRRRDDVVDRLLVVCDDVSERGFRSKLQNPSVMWCGPNMKSSDADQTQTNDQKAM